MQTQLIAILGKMSAANPPSMDMLNSVSDTDVDILVVNTRRSKAKDYDITINHDGLELKISFSHQGRIFNVYPGKLVFSNEIYTYCRGPGVYNIQGLDTDNKETEKALGQVINYLGGLAIKLGD